MHYFVADMARVDVGTVSTFIKQAEGIYDENLSAYVKIVLRRPFAKLIVRIISDLILTFAHSYMFDLGLLRGH